MLVIGERRRLGYWCPGEGDGWHRWYAEGTVESHPDHGTVVKLDGHNNDLCPTCGRSGVPDDATEPFNPPKGAGP